MQWINAVVPPRTTADVMATRSSPEFPEIVQLIRRAEELGPQNTPAPPGAQFPEITQFLMVGEDTQ